MRTAFAVVGFVFTAIVASVVAIRVMAKYGHLLVSGAKVANKHISTAIKMAA